MGEPKRINPEGRATHAEAALVEASKDRMWSAIDRFTHAVRWQMRDTTPDMMAVALGTTVGVFAASAGRADGAGAIATRVDEVARAVIEQSQQVA